MLLISSITHSALAFLHSYPTVRGDDEPPLLIWSHVSMMCLCVAVHVCVSVRSLVCGYDVAYLVYFFNSLLHICSPCFVHTHKHTHTHTAPRAPKYHEVADRHYVLIWIKCPSAAACVDLFSHNACLGMGLMGRWLPGG